MDGDYIFRFWGKSRPYKSLVSHMIDTGCMAKALMEKGSLKAINLNKYFNAPQNDIASTIAYFASLHDIGKCHPYFQRQNSESQVYDFLLKNDLFMPNSIDIAFRHERYSATVIRRIFNECNIISKKSSKLISKILEMHHQGKNGTSFEISENMEEWWFKAQDNIHSIMSTLFKPVRIDIESTPHVDAACMSILGVIILADWIASGTWFDELGDAMNPFEYYTRSYEKAVEVIQEIGFLHCANLPVDKGFTGIWRSIPENSLRPLQIDVQSICEKNHSRLIIIEAPMGEGKTEAGIYVAACMADFNDKNGIYFALPTAATSNQMYLRVSELLQDHNISPAQLLHSMAWVFDEKMPERPVSTEDSDDAYNWFAPLKRGLLADYAVGTVDQAMLAALKVKYGVLRLLGLANKVLIIDEIHAYDAYMSRIIERLLQWCAALNIPVVLLSATLPLKKRQDFVLAYGGDGAVSNAYPLVTIVNDSNKVRELKISDTYIKQEIAIQNEIFLNLWTEAALLAVQKVREGGCLCIIVNTVNDAQRLYQEIEGNCDRDTELLLFHARFLAKDRNEIEKACITKFGKNGGRPEKAILVATQVVEQSLDLDFDEMMTAVAPIDLLLQRAGRIHRHEGRRRPLGMNKPKLTVLIPQREGDYGPTKKIYPPILLNRTVDWMTSHGLVRIPQDIRTMIEQVYSINPVDENEIEDWAKWRFDENLKKGAALDYELPSPNPKAFSLAESGGSIFDDNENNSGYLAAKTRLGESSRRVAFLPDDFDFPLNDEDMRNKNIAKEVMSFSVSLRQTQIGIQPSQGFEPPQEGRGLLRGMLLYKLKEDCYRLEHEQIIGYRLDNKLGVIIERK